MRLLIHDCIIGAHQFAHICSSIGLFSPLAKVSFCLLSSLSNVCYSRYIAAPHKKNPLHNFLRGVGVTSKKFESHLDTFWFFLIFCQGGFWVSLPSLIHPILNIGSFTFFKGVGNTPKKFKLLFWSVLASAKVSFSFCLTSSLPTSFFKLKTGQHTKSMHCSL